MKNKTDFFAEPLDFSLVVGGPLYRFYLRTKLVKQPLDSLYRRIIVVSLLTWLPLLLLTTFAGQTLGGVPVPFLFDLDAHARFLASLPLLIAAELTVHRRMRIIVRQFLESGIITPEDRVRFEGIVASTMRLRNSVITELLLVVLAFTVLAWVWQEHLSLNVVTWYATRTDGQMRLTLAGYWYAFVSLPVTRFLLLRWCFRLFIWYRFLWQVSRLPLRLNPLHSDRAGGLGFLTGSVFTFAPVLFAQTVLLAGLIGNRIWHQGATLMDFKLEIVGLLVILLLIVLVPLTFFCVQLAVAKRTGLREYGIVASRYVGTFRQKWIEGGAPENEALLGSADIQSLADLSNSFDVVRETRLVPFSKETVLQLAIIIVLPLLPLTLTVVPLDAMIDRIVGVLL